VDFDVSDATRRRVTAADVAAAAGVSATTVSYVLNERPHQSIPDSTRRRVVETAARLGYAPSPAARMLATGRSNLVLGLLADWPIGDNAGQFFRRLTAAFADRGYVFVSHTSTDEPGRAAGSDLLWRTIAPAAVLLFDDADQGRLDRMHTAGIGVTLVVSSGSGDGAGVMERLDHHAGLVQARHLIATGHRHLGYAWPDDSRLLAWANPRLAGVRAACADAGLDPPDVRTVPLTAAGAAAAVAGWRGARPAVTAVCAYNDEVAIAVLQGLRDLGCTAPADIAVIGMDDVPTSGLVHTPLTTVNFDRTGVSRFIADAVVDAVAGQSLREPPFADFIRLIQRGTA
jgi:DNA-binding LacI/PurR family transcriptional regulator